MRLNARNNQALEVNGRVVEMVDSFQYLESIVTASRKNNLGSGDQKFIYKVFWY